MKEHGRNKGEQDHPVLPVVVELEPGEVAVSLTDTDMLELYVACSHYRWYLKDRGGYATKEIDRVKNLKSALRGILGAR